MNSKMLHCWAHVIIVLTWRCWAYAHNSRILKTNFILAIENQKQFQVQLFTIQTQIGWLWILCLLKLPQSLSYLRPASSYICLCTPKFHPSMSKDHVAWLMLQICQWWQVTYQLWPLQKGWCSSSWLSHTKPDTPFCFILYYSLFYRKIRI